LAKKSRVWDGTAWQELASAQTDLTAYSTTAQMNTAITAGVGLVPILTQTIGTAVSSIVVSNAFSATYDNYKILISGGTSSADTHFKMTLGATTTGYYFSELYRTYAGTSGADHLSNGAFFNAGSARSNGLIANVEILNPFLSTRTAFSQFHGVPKTTDYMSIQAGFLDNATSYTGFTITPNTGTITGGTIRVYGYKN
jgi:hypothetical protein